MNKQVKMIVKFFTGLVLVVLFLLLTFQVMFVRSFNPPLWDVLALVIVPIVLAVGVYGLNRMQQKNELDIETRPEQETILQNYFDRMELRLESGLGKSKPGHEFDQFLDGLSQPFLTDDLDLAKAEKLRNEIWSEVEIENNLGTIARTLTLTTLRRLDGTLIANL